MGEFLLTMTANVCVSSVVRFRSRVLSPTPNVERRYKLWATPHRTIEETFCYAHVPQLSTLSSTDAKALVSVWKSRGFGIGAAIRSLCISINKSLYIFKAFLKGHKAQFFKQVCCVLHLMIFSFFSLLCQLS